MRHTSPHHLALGTVFLLLLAACGKEPAAVNPRVVLVTQAKASGSGAQVFAGDVRALQEVTLSFRVAGKISQRFVDAGARVVAGQVLARLDDSDLNLQSQAATASVQALKADRDLAQSELRRYQDLVVQKLVSQSLFDSKKAQAEAAQSRYRQALAQSQVNANQTGYAVIRAPGPGVISQRFAEAGQVVGAGQGVFTFAADGARDVAITVAEQHLPRLRLGQPVSIELWTQSGQRYAGKIREIAGSADTLTRTYAVRVALEDASAITQLGQSARVLMDDGSDRTIRVPMSALTETGDKSPALWVLGADGKIRKRAVSVARYGAEQAEISSGIALNEWFVQAGVHLLREAEAVSAVDAGNRAVRAVNAP